MHGAMPSPAVRPSPTRWTTGGIFAEALAVRHPDRLLSVITCSTPMYLPASAQEASIIPRVEAWERNSGAEFAPEKTALIHFSRTPRRVQNAEGLLIKGISVVASPQVKILGLVMDPAVALPCPRRTNGQERPAYGSFAQEAVGAAATRGTTTIHLDSGAGSRLCVGSMVHICFVQDGNGRRTSPATGRHGHHRGF